MRYAVVIGILLIAIPLLVRYQSAEPFPDASSYEELRQSKLGNYDSLYATPHTPTLTNWLFGHVQPQLLLVILAAITLLALSMYYDNEAFILLFATTPVFIKIFTTVSEASVGTAIIAIGALLIKYRQYWAVLLVPLCFSLSFSLGIIATIAFIAAALIEKLVFVSLGASFFALVSGIVAAAMNPVFSIGLTTVSVAEALSLFGTPTGLTLFLALLGVIGFIVLYNKNHNAELFVSLLIIPFALFFENGMILIAAVVAYYASKAWTFLVERKWNFDEVQTLTLMLIACGILFTAIVVEKERIELDEERVAVTRFIRSAYPQGTLVAAHDNVAPILAYHGYPSYMPEIPENAGFIASSLADKGFALVATNEEKPPYNHFPVVYQSREEGYTVFEVPRY
jgi:hypothetical protein